MADIAQGACVAREPTARSSDLEPQDEVGAKRRIVSDDGVFVGRGIGSKGNGVAAHDCLLRDGDTERAGLAGERGRIGAAISSAGDRKRVVSGQSVSERVDLGGGGGITKKKRTTA